MAVSSTPQPPAWKLMAALVAVYLSWGTTYLAIKEGVKTLPPCLFGGARIGAAGLVLLAFVLVTGRPKTLSASDLFRTWLHSLLLFVGGNGLITIGQKTVPSGEASVLVATVPLWLGLAESFWPGGERLTALGWAGLLTGLAGLAVLRWQELGQPAMLFRDVATLYVLGSAVSWAIASVILRHRRVRGDRLTVAAYQMVLGGATLILVGIAAGEATELTRVTVTSQVVVAFCYLLVVGSLIGFLCYSWLLTHVSTTVAGTYAYVTPVVAIFTGWLLGGESLTGQMVAGMIVILAGVALVRSGESSRLVAIEADEAAACPPMPQSISSEAEKI